ncbi:MAG: hypothetical protein JWN17_1349, partial [Frankiales bacterium]|nr:hypothetical protein [Frankiales bacterium]
MRRTPRAALLSPHRRALTELAALLVGEPDLAAGVVAGAARGRSRTPEALLAAARRSVLRTARRTASPWTRCDPLAAVPRPEREVLALRATTELSLPAVAHLLDLPLTTAVTREAQGLAVVGCPDAEALRELLRPWLAQVPLEPAVVPAVRRSGGLRSGLAVAGLAVVAVLAVVVPDAVPAPAVRPAVQAEVAPRPARPVPGCRTGDDLCAPTPGPRPQAVAPLAFWPFATDRQAADWAVDDGGRPWAADPVEVARRLGTDLLGLRGVRVRAVGGGVVTLRADGVPGATVRLVRLGRGARRPWSVTQVVSPGLVLADPGPLAPTTPVTGTGTAALRLLAPDGAVLGRAPALGGPLPWRRVWSSAAVVAVGPA